MNKSITLVSTVFLFLIGFLSPAAFAQQTSALQQIRTIQVKSGRAAEFEELLARVTAAQEEAGQTRRSVWQEVRGNLGTYHMLTPLDSYADLDEQEEPPMAPAAWANLISRIVDTSESQKLRISRNYPNLTIPAGEDTGPPEFIRLSFYDVTWGGNGAFMRWLEDSLLPALSEAGVQGMGFTKMVEGDSPRRWYSARPFQDWAELDEPGPFADMTPAERQEVLGAGGDLILSGENTVLRRRPDLMAQ